MNSDAGRCTDGPIMTHELKPLPSQGPREPGRTSARCDGC